MADKRPDPQDPAGKKYTKDEFLDFYGKKDGAALWSKAGVIMRSAGGYRPSATKYYVGMPVVATGRLAGDKGQVVEKGQRGKVTAVAGPNMMLEDGAVAEVCIGGVTFDAQHDMICPVGRSPPRQRYQSPPRHRPPPAPAPRGGGGKGRERRPDPTQGGSYTREEFQAYYGPSKGAQIWSEAGESRSPRGGKGGRKGGGAPEPRRADPKESGGKQYSRAQFIEYYGPEQGAALWKKAGEPAAKSGKGGGAAREGKGRAGRAEKSEKRPREPAFETQLKTVTISREKEDDVIGWNRTKRDCRITSVTPDTPAAKAGVEVGMVIVSIAGKQVPSDEACLEALKEVGKDFEVVLSKKVEVTAAEGAKEARPSPFVEETLSLKRESADAAVGWRLRKGLLVAEVMDESPAAAAKVPLNAKVQVIAGKKIESEEDVAEALKEAGTEFDIVISKRRVTPDEERPPRFEEVTVQITRESESAAVGWTTEERMIVSAVAEGSPAEKAGILKKWKIQSIGETRVETVEALEEALKAAGVSFSAVLTRRRKELKEAKEKVAERRADPKEKGSRKYTKAEFQEYYGKDTEKMWALAGEKAATAKKRKEERKEKEGKKEAAATEKEEIEAVQGSPSRKVRDYVEGSPKWESGAEESEGF